MDTLSGKEILVTSGPTRVPLDEVRFISSRSSGKLGVEIACLLLAHGAKVTFLHGTGSLRPDPGEGVNFIEVETIDELIGAVEGLRKRNFDIIFHAMAVSDFAPEKPRKGKVSSRDGTWDIRLVKTPKVIRLIREIWPDAILVGFKLEVGKNKETLIETARNFVSGSGIDLAVVNDLTEITGNRHIAYIVSKKGEVVGVAYNKKDIAAKLVRLTEEGLAATGKSSGIKNP